MSVKRHGFSAIIFGVFGILVANRHFWTKAWSENVAKALTAADFVHINNKSKKLIAGAIKAIEGFVNIAGDGPLNRLHKFS